MIVCSFCEEENPERARFCLACGEPLAVAAVCMALDDERRWSLVESALGTISDHGHEWDDDVAAWVWQQRRTDASRVG